MLVLSRKSNEEITFPSLGVTIRVLRTKANCVKIGVIAPQNVRVLRGELAGLDDLIKVFCDLKSHIQSHDIRNRLNHLVLQLELLNRLQQTGLSESDLGLIEQTARSLDELESTFSQLVVAGSCADAVSDPTRLLVVDDDANERQLLCSVLSLQGFDVTSAGDGIEAVQLLNCDSRLPHAILLDMHMPRQGGETTLRCIRSDNRLSHLKVVGVSGNEPRMHLLPDDVPGFDAWFTKPLEVDRLVSLIHQPEFVQG